MNQFRSIAAKAVGSVGLAVLAIAGPVMGQAIPDTVGVFDVGVGADAWVWLGHAPGDRNHIFVMDGSGSISVVNVFRPQRVGGLPEFQTRPVPFLTGNSPQARSVAFAPDFVAGVGGRFYVAAEAASAFGNTDVTEYRTRADDPWQADPTSARRIMRLPVRFDHAVGSIGFDASGMLLIGVGDNFTSSNSQNLGNLFGKLLRIDVLSGGDAFPNDVNQNYAIPADNPLVGRQGAMPEILHIGLRNPWRWSFDRWNGDLWMTDVGANNAGEINRVGSQIPYLNFGWSRRDGIDEGFSSFINPDFTLASLVVPVEGLRRFAGMCSTSGGARYVGAMLRGWRGRYVFADYCYGVWSRDYSVAGSTLMDHSTQMNNIRGATNITNNFTMVAEDGAGELYLLTGLRGNSGGGRVYAIVPQGTQPALADIAGEGGSLGADGVYDNNDFVVFIQQFFANDPRADIGTQGGVWGADFVLDNNDFIVFIGAFFEGR